MKRNLRSTMLVIVFFTAFAMSVVPTAQAQDEGSCSNATAAGQWGFTTAGTQIQTGHGGESRGDSNQKPKWPPG